MTSYSSLLFIADLLTAKLDIFFTLSILLIHQMLLSKVTNNTALLGMNIDLCNYTLIKLFLVFGYNILKGYLLCCSCTHGNTTLYIILWLDFKVLFLFFYPSPSFSPWFVTMLCAPVLCCLQLIRPMSSSLSGVFSLSMSLCLCPSGHLSIRSSVWHSRWLNICRMCMNLSLQPCLKYILRVAEAYKLLTRIITAFWVFLFQPPYFHSHLFPCLLIMDYPCLMPVCAFSPTLYSDNNFWISSSKALSMRLPPVSTHHTFQRVSTFINFLLQHYIRNQSRQSPTYSEAFVIENSLYRKREKIYVV